MELVLLLKGDISFRGGNGTYGIGFVSQQDYLLPYLTVKETLAFAARLVRPSKAENRDQIGHRSDSKQSGMTEAELNALVWQVVLDLGLKEVADNFIGQDGIAIAGRRGISGGEKRRVSAGIQILSDPQVEDDDIVLIDCGTTID